MKKSNFDRYNKTFL
uniref:Uncharacterized protein n=1 Tax=Anguilla anguilla TaxID=7936 RepID=A0A0E9QZR7_ANGAN